MLTKKIEDLSVQDINDELAFAGIDKIHKRIDFAQKHITRAVLNGDVKVSDDVANSYGKGVDAKSKPEKETKTSRYKSLGFEPKTGWVESPWQGRKVFVPKGQAILQLEARENGPDEPETHFQVELVNGEVRGYPRESVRFNAIDDRYRDGYVHDSSVRTESGAISIHCGDDLSSLLLGYTQLELQGVAKENDLKNKFKLWVEKGLKPGMVRMNLGNILRARVKRGEKVLINGKGV